MNDRVSSPEDLEAVEKSAKNDSKAAETQAASYHGLDILISNKKISWSFLKNGCDSIKAKC